MFTPLIVGLFTWLAKRKREPNTPVKIGLGMVIAGLSSLLMIFAVMSVNVYHNKTEMYWIVSTYALFTVGELLDKPGWIINGVKTGACPVNRINDGRLVPGECNSRESCRTYGYFLGLILLTRRAILPYSLLRHCIAGSIMFAMSKWLAKIVKEKTGVD